MLRSPESSLVSPSRPRKTVSYARLRDDNLVDLSNVHVFKSIGHHQTLVVLGTGSADDGVDRVDLQRAMNRARTSIAGCYDGLVSGAGADPAPVDADFTIQSDGSVLGYPLRRVRSNSASKGVGAIPPTSSLRCRMPARTRLASP